MQVCFQELRSLGDDNGTIDWGDGSEVNFQTVIDKDDSFSTKKSHDSCSSEEEDEDPCDMEIDPSDSKLNLI